MQWAMPVRSFDAMKRTTIVAVALAATALLPAAAQARADVGTFSNSYDAADAGLVDECFGGTDGVLSGHGDVAGRYTQTPNGFSARGTEIDTVRIDFGDGSSFVGSSLDRFSFVVTRGGTSVNTVPHVDGGTTYDADGNVLGTTTFRAVEHFTVVDRQPAGPGPEDVVRVRFERGRLTCG
jgi:hypothetical protein